MNLLRKIFSGVCLALCASVLFSGCGYNKNSKKYRIGVSQCSDDDWRKKMNEEIEREVMVRSDVEVEIRSADDNNEKQISDIQYFLDNDFDIIIVAPNEADAITPIIKKAYDGGTPVELLLRLRLQRSRHLLTTTEKSVSEIAYEVGFSTPAYFTKCFRDCFGKTPSELREELGA